MLRSKKSQRHSRRVGGRPTLPLRRVRLSLASARPIVPRERSAARGFIVATVLLVEDNHDVADMIALALELEGHDVHVAYDGAAGLREAARIEPDIGVLDIGLPKLDGIELGHA